MGRKQSKAKTFEEAAAELGEARPLDDVLRQLIKPEKKKPKGSDEKSTDAGTHGPGE